MTSPFSITPLSRDDRATSTVTYITQEMHEGTLLIAATDTGVTNIIYADTPEQAHAELQARWPKSTRLIEGQHSLHALVRAYLSETPTTTPLPLHLSGTPFQHAVWHALLEIPRGTTTTYSALATAIGRPRASRAVGTAVSANPIAMLIPCHRVLPASGKIGSYRWGAARKRALLAAEGAAFGE